MPKKLAPIVLVDYSFDNHRYASYSGGRIVAESHFGFMLSKKWHHIKEQITTYPNYQKVSITEYEVPNDREFDVLLEPVEIASHYRGATACMFKVLRCDAFPALVGKKLRGDLNIIHYMFEEKKLLFDGRVKVALKLGLMGVEISTKHTIHESV